MSNVRHMNRADLLRPEFFANDEPVGIAAVPISQMPGPTADCSWVYVSERLWSRLLAVGAGYGLHFSEVIEPVIDTVLNAQQCESLLEELKFLKSVLADAALGQVMDAISTEASTVVRSQKLCLVLSPP